MKKFPNLFDNLSSLKNEYKNTLKEPINNVRMSGNKLIAQNNFHHFIKTPIYSRQSEMSLENNIPEKFRTPYQGVHVSPFPDLDSVFRERRQYAKREIQRYHSENLYNILCLEVNASQNDITKAYRKLSLKYHPDKNDGNDNMFVQINHAYKILSNCELRSIYDEHGLAFVESYIASMN